MPDSYIRERHENTIRKDVQLFSSAEEGNGDKDGKKEDYTRQTDS